ncbi:ParB N-terminal domain-containing protein [Tropicibacter sp. R15_0]|uniref:ParB/RepB/Spo0J family partition protein n=1 Tax=Tropicibacter sp. R15_0 TaxID=2821101 RepID=UPI001ADA9472|nr:ParB N-terminal domain-containing protein [Tropicibacter sp. R15_0]MBO9468051.1 ParB N-terminal domain-containing protein [Tropicibacter sp. R15_0]
MAKRKRLTPANPAFLEPAPEVKSALGAPMRAAPIADVAREASASAAAEELAQTLAEAREKGRMVIEVPLEAVKLDHLVRDRVAVQDDDTQALKDSLRARGQKTPVELVQIGEGRYGLISGWRRCMALRALQAETNEARFGTVLGLLRQPEDSADAYQSMVEENEIRVGLSYFERARIVAKSVEAGVFETDRDALQALFQSASRPKRSKIGSFIALVRGLEGALRFPEMIGERLGLSLSRALGEDPELAVQIAATLAEEAPESAEAEQEILSRFLAPAPVVPSPKPPEAAEPAAKVANPKPDPVKPQAIVGGLSLSHEEGRLVLEGRLVDDKLKARLITWLRQNF